VVYDVKPAEKGMDQSPEDTMVDFPTQQGRKDGTNAAKDTAAATPAALLFFNLHLVFP
jgi:hypothetical protein